MSDVILAIIVTVYSVAFLFITRTCVPPSPKDHLLDNGMGGEETTLKSSQAHREVVGDT